MEIEQRLGLYQVFLKIYEYHRGLLDEILQLEKTGHKTSYGLATRCVMGVIQGEQVYLIANLVGGKTQTLFQPQGIWPIGRDRQLAIAIPDKQLSRHHAAIEYIKNQGFYLVDLNSTNGSFINAEPVSGRIQLRDGDRVRLGSLAFSFFLCHDTQRLDEIPPEILAKLEASTEMPTAAPTTPIAEPKEETLHFLQEQSELEESVVESEILQLSAAQREEILDRFFSRVGKFRR